MPSSKRPIDDLFLTTTPIKFPGKDDEWGTGFFYRKESTDYLVTNYHVVNDEDKITVTV